MVIRGPILLQPTKEGTYPLKKRTKLMVTAKRKYHAKAVSFSDISPDQICWKCRRVIRDLGWWKETNTAYHYRYYVYCGECLYRAWYPVKDSSGSTHYLHKPANLK